MSIRIGHASIDENGKAQGGAAGDQTGFEVCTRSWYAKGWNKIIRAKDTAVAEKIAATMEAACANDNIGYDQGQRTTLYSQAKAKNWNLSAISVKCECDCSSLVAVCVNAAGIAVSKDIYTGNEANALKNTGKFEILTDSKYLTQDKHLKRGDILLKEGSHTAVALSNGSAAGASNTTNTIPSGNDKVDSAQSRDNSLAGTYTTTSNLHLRNGAGIGKKSLVVMPKGTVVQNYGYYTNAGGKKWLYVQAKIKGVLYTGFCSIAYLKK